MISFLRGSLWISMIPNDEISFQIINYFLFLSRYLTFLRPTQMLIRNFCSIVFLKKSQTVPKALLKSKASWRLLHSPCPSFLSCRPGLRISRLWIASLSLVRLGRCTQCWLGRLLRTARRLDRGPQSAPRAGRPGVLLRRARRRKISLWESLFLGAAI